MNRTTGYLRKARAQVRLRGITTVSMYASRQRQPSVQYSVPVSASSCTPVICTLNWKVCSACFFDDDSEDKY